MADAKKRGGNVSPLPRDFGFPVQKGETWHDIYDLIRLVHCIMYLIIGYISFFFR